MGLRSVGPAQVAAPVPRPGRGSLRSASELPGQLSSLQWPSTALTPTGSVRRPVRRTKWRTPSPVQGSALAVRPAPGGCVQLPPPPAVPGLWVGILAPNRGPKPGSPSDRLPSGGRLAGGPMPISATPTSQISHLWRPTRIPPEGTPVYVAGTFPCPDPGQHGPAPPAVFLMTSPALVPFGCRATPSVGYSSLAATVRPPISRW